MILSHSSSTAPPRRATQADGTGGSCGCIGRCIRCGLLAGVLITGLAGCGYSSESLHRSTVRTVFVDIFQSKEFRRGIEFQLTEAVRKQIDRATPYKNEARPKADSIIEGEILEWREATIGHDFITDRPRDTAATLAVRFRWQDRRTGKLLVDQPRLVTTVQYVRPVGEAVFDARENACNQLARKIVEYMESPW